MLLMFYFTAFVLRKLFVIGQIIVYDIISPQFHDGFIPKYREQHAPMPFMKSYQPRSHTRQSMTGEINVIEYFKPGKYMTGF